jgi:hypothetical protein
MKLSKTFQNYIWKYSKYDGMIPIINFVEGVHEEDKNKMLR